MKWYVKAIFFIEDDFYNPMIQLWAKIMAVGFDVCPDRDPVGDGYWIVYSTFKDYERHVR